MRYSSREMMETEEAKLGILQVQKRRLYESVCYEWKKKDGIFDEDEQSKQSPFFNFSTRLIKNAD